MATRARIIDNAAALMYTRGVAATSIDAVRRSAAVSGSQITHYFRDKKALIRQVVARRRGDVRNFHSQPQLGGLDTLVGAARVGRRLRRRLAHRLLRGRMCLRLAGR